jgi:deoxyribose-phosphate aldolase
MEGATTLRHVELIASVVKDRIWIKAAGGIRDLETIDRMLDMGVKRFGINFRSAKMLCDAANTR